MHNVFTYIYVYIYIYIYIYVEKDREIFLFYMAPTWMTHPSAIITMMMVMLTGETAYHFRIIFFV